MKTYTVQRAPSVDFDTLLVDRLGPFSLPVDGVAGTIRIGIAGVDGAPYRVIETSSLLEAVRVFETLNDLGLVPRGRRLAGDGMARVFGVAKHGAGRPPV